MKQHYNISSADISTIAPIPLILDNTMFPPVNKSKTSEAVMIKNMSDFPFHCKSTVCKREERFKSMVERLFGIKVKQTLFMKGAKNQHHLYIWHEQTAGESIWENNDFIQQNIIRNYFDCYNIPDDCLKETYLHILDYRNALISYSYGHAEASVKNAIQNQFANTAVSLDYASNTFVVESDHLLTDREDDILHTLYQFLKKYDDYNIITLQDVKFKIIKRGDQSDLNDVHMMNRKI